MLIVNFIKGFDVVYNIILEKVMSHELFVDVPPYSHDIKILKHNQQWIKNFISSLSSHVTSVIL
jgi:hypothetical protein